MEAHGAGLQRVLVLAFCVAGIWSAYIYQGVLQETLYVTSVCVSARVFDLLLDDASFKLLVSV